MRLMDVLACLSFIAAAFGLLWCWLVLHGVGPLAPPNAQLIAAAPELLEACYEALSGDPDYEQIRAAIAKAEGRA